MQVQPAIVLGVAGLLALGFAANEATRGGVAESMGLGHRHMMDYDGAHCTALDGPLWDQHVQHMHGGDRNATHVGCGSGHHPGMGHMGGMMP